MVQNDAGEEWIFPNANQPFGIDVSDELCKFLFTEAHQGMYIIAHNLRVYPCSSGLLVSDLFLQGFDGYFLLKWLLHNGIVPEVIMNGGKILCCNVKEFDIKLRDSYNYNPQSLAKWPQTFGMTDIGKGNFPHRFNRQENWDKVCPSSE